MTNTNIARILHDLLGLHSWAYSGPQFRCCRKCGLQQFLLFTDSITGYARPEVWVNVEAILA